MFAVTNIPETFVDFNSLGFGGILGAGTTILYILVFLFVAGLSLFWIEPHGRPPI